MNDQRGAILLITLLVFSVVGMAVVSTLLLLGISSTQTSFTREQSVQTKALADACAEEALQQIRSSTPFVGSGSLTLGEGSCSYTVTSLGASSREIQVSANVDEVTRKVLVEIDTINPTINIVSWQEVADY